MVTIIDTGRSWGRLDGCNGAACVDNGLNDVDDGRAAFGDSIESNLNGSGDWVASLVLFDVGDKTDGAIFHAGDDNDGALADVGDNTDGGLAVVGDNTDAVLFEVGDNID